MTESRLYFKQLLSGLDFAMDDFMAQQMANFVYIIGDRETGEAIIVDPAYGVAELLEIAGEDDMRITGALGTHFHADHIGGDLMGHPVEGFEALLELQGMKLHVQALETEWVQKTTSLSVDDIQEHEPGDTLDVGSIQIQMMHTPGHTPGSQCFLVDGKLIAGDTLFLTGCGRTDLPGSKPSDMYKSLQRLSELPDEIVVFPGHNYSMNTSATMATTREQNMVFRPSSEEQWLRAFAQ
jgi:hydroxyacylglutathione hydrolase